MVPGVLEKEIRAAWVALRSAESRFDEMDPQAPLDLRDAATLRVSEARKHLNGLYAKAKEDLGLPINTNGEGDRCLQEIRGIERPASAVGRVNSMRRKAGMKVVVGDTRRRYRVIR